MKSSNDTMGRQAWFVQLVGFVRKEVFEIVRQPRLLLVLVIGPFLVLALFAVGFDQQKTVLTTTFVGPADGIYEESVNEFAEELSQYIVFDGYTTDLVAAQRSLDAGDVDLVVVFPTDPAQSVLAGEQAQINILHDKIDPIQRTTVEVSAQVAVQELNARILEEVVTTTQASLVPYRDSVDNSSVLLERLGTAVAARDEVAVEQTLNELDDSVGALSTIVNLSSDVSGRLGASQQRRDEIDNLSASTETLSTQIASMVDAGGSVSSADVAAANELLEVVRQQGETVTTLDPAVIVRPFVGDTANLQRETVTVADFFAPGAIALLLQHMALTFAAMSLVSDRSRGLFEIFKVGPIGPGNVLLGKYVSFTLIGGVVAAALMAAVKFGLDVPMRGPIWWIVVGLLALVISSIGLGTLISLISKSDTQAVQYSLLALLAGLFFGGFFLDLDAFRYPAKAMSWILPVTYGTRILRDVMLRGDDPAFVDLAGLGATAAVFLGLSWWLLARRLRVE